MHFFHFYSCSSILFRCKLFLFQRIWKHHEILRFLISIINLSQKKFLVRSALFCKLWSRKNTNGLERSKTCFLNVSWNSFYPEQGLSFLFSLKNQICCILMYNKVHLAEFWTSCIIQYGDTNIHFIHERYLAVGR